MAMTQHEEMYRGNGAITQREDFGGTEIAHVTETASTAAAAQAQAAVQARYVMALKRPRDYDQVRVRLLKDCARLRFAEVAKYRKPVGKKKNDSTGKWEQQFVEGPSIRFAEAALRAMTNVLPEISTIYDDKEKRIVRAAVTDLESNLTWSKDIVIEKAVERSNADGRTLISQRLNSYGKTTYTVVATDDEIALKEASLVSKAMRQHALRIMPGDLVEEAMDKCYATIKAGVNQDPDAYRHKLADGFSKLGVTPAQLAEYLGHPLAESSPAEMAELGQIGSSIKDGETTWSDVMEGRTEKLAAPDEAPAQPKTTADLAKRAKAKKAEQQEAPMPSDADEPGSNG